MNLAEKYFLHAAGLTHINAIVIQVAHLSRSVSIAKLAMGKRAWWITKARHTGKITHHA